MKRRRLYSKFHQVMDYAFPLLLLVTFLSIDLSLAPKLILGVMVIVSILISIKTYRSSIDSHNLYLNNLFMKKHIPISNIKTIEPAPFYYGATSGRLSEKGYRIVYEKNNTINKVVVLVSKKQDVEQIWDELKQRTVKTNLAYNQRGAS